MTRLKNRKGPDFMTTYVRLSRVVSLEGVFLLSEVYVDHHVSLRLPRAMVPGVNKMENLAENALAAYWHI